MVIRWGDDDQDSKYLLGYRLFLKAENSLTDSRRKKRFYVDLSPADLSPADPSPADPSPPNPSPLI
jgi:hypothetical protein